MVTRDKIQETVIGNRGSKSISIIFFARAKHYKKGAFRDSFIVKEQRVYGS